MNKRKKLVDSKIIFLFGAGVITIFLLLFHKAEQLKAMFESVQPDRISVTYLQLLVNMDPTDYGSRLALARQYVAIGKIDDARETLKPFSNLQGLEASEGKLLNLELDLNAYFAKPELDASKKQDLLELQTKIAALAKQDIPETLLSKVIEKSLALNKPDMAALLYQRWAKMDSSKSFEHLQEAGRWYIAAGKPMSAADMYHKVFTSTKHDQTAKKYAVLALNATRAANQGKIGLDYLKDFRSRFPDDQDLLNEAIALSLATNDPKQAFELGNSKLIQDSNNPEHIAKQLELALAVAKLDIALALAEQLATIKPLDFSVRRRAAQIAEWSGKPEQALKHWAQLVNLGDTEIATHDNFYRLATSLKKPEPIITALSNSTKKRTLTETELNLLLDSASKQADAIKIANFLHAYLKHYPTHENAWLTYAKSQINAENINAALQTLKYLSANFKNNTQLALLEASLLNKTGQPGQAYQHLLAAKSLATTQDLEFWQSFADLSWEHKQTDNALEAYQLLWQAKQTNVITAERIIQLLRDKKQPKAGIALAKSAYQTFKDSRWLLLAMDTASQFKSWQDLAELLKTANANENQFKKTEMFWLLRAQLSSHLQQPSLALSEYKAALKINPKSKAAKDGIMWNLIGQQDKVNSRINLASNSIKAVITRY